MSLLLFFEINIFIAKANYDIRFRNLLLVVHILLSSSWLCMLFHVELMPLLWLATRLKIYAFICAPKKDELARREQKPTKKNIHEKQLNKTIL